jgi:hypothetical protein
MELGSFITGLLLGCWLYLFRLAEFIPNALYSNESAKLLIFTYGARTRLVFHFVPWNQLAASNFFINCAPIIKLKLFLVYSMVQVELLFLSQIVRYNLCI